MTPKSMLRPRMRWPPTLKCPKQKTSVSCCVAPVPKQDLFTYIFFNHSFSIKTRKRVYPPHHPFLLITMNILTTKTSWHAFSNATVLLASPVSLTHLLEWASRPFSQPLTHYPESGFQPWEAPARFPEWAHQPWNVPTRLHHSEGVH